MKAIVAAIFLTVLVTVQGKVFYSPFTTLKDFVKNYGNSRIISGEPARLGQFPWQVAVYIKLQSGTAFCGGSLINENWVMTAAHCVDGGREWTVVVGTIASQIGADPNQVIRKTDEAYYHEGYNFFLNNDIALIRLKEPIEMSANIQPIKIQTSKDDLAGKTVTVSGWGKTSDSSNTISNTLNFVNLTAIKNAQCAEVYGSLVVIDSTLCAVGHPRHSTCNGDSGGPLITYDKNGNPVQCGVVSFVHIKGCASGNPSGYVRTNKYINWISEKTGLTIDQFT